MKINLFGVSHVAQKSEMQEQLEDYIEDKELDAIFIERLDEEPGIKEKLKASLMNPSLMLFKYLYKHIGDLLVFLKNLTRRREINWTRDDGRIAKELSNELNIPLYNVDKSIEKSILDEGWIWTALSWTVFLALSAQIFQFGYLIFVGEFYSILGLGAEIFGLIASLFFAVSILIAFPFIIAEVDSRNIYMLNNLQEISEENDYENVLMITGRKHVEGFETLIQMTPDSCSSENYTRKSLRQRIQSRVGGIASR